MATVAQILRVIGATINSGINAAGITTPGQVVVGWPTAPQGAAIWGAGQWLITLYPMKAQNDSRYKPTPRYIVPPPAAPLVATVATSSSTTQTLTFSGTNTAALNIWTVAGAPALQSLYQTAGTETLAQIATTVAANLTTLGFTASATGDVVTIASKAPVWCNIGQSAQIIGGIPQYVSEVGRFKRLIQATVWASIPDIATGNSDGSRENLEFAMLESIGGTDAAWNISPDQSAFSALWRSTGDWSDKAESSYTVFRSDNFLEIDYALLRPMSGTPVGVIDMTTQIGAHSPSTAIIGGH